MEQQFDELPGWRFTIDEVSAGVYEVIARDNHGRTFQAKGIDPEALLQRAREYAALITDGRFVE